MLYLEDELQTERKNDQAFGSESVSTCAAAGQTRHNEAFVTAPSPTRDVLQMASPGRTPGIALAFYEITVRNGATLGI